MVRSKHSGGEPSGIASRGGSVAALVVLALLSAPAMAQEGASVTGRTGINTDAKGGLAVDPSKNVLDTVSALKEMLKELRTTDKELLDAKILGARDLNDMRSRYDKELLRAAADQLNSEAKLRAEFNERYALTEKGRVDAIRLVDKNAVDVATAGSVATAAALAKTVADSASVLSAQVTRQADDLRVLVKTTADEANRNQQQNAQSVQTQFTAIGTRLTALEQAGAEGAGRQKFQDPAIAQLLSEFRLSRERESGRTGVDAGRGDVIGWIIGGASFLIMMLIAIGGLFVKLNQPRSK